MNLKTDMSLVPTVKAIVLSSIGEKGTGWSTRKLTKLNGVLGSPLSSLFSMMFLVSVFIFVHIKLTVFHLYRPRRDAKGS